MNPPLFAARAEFFKLAGAPGQFDDFLPYIRAHNINSDLSPFYFGAWGVVSVIDCGNGRFDFHETHQDKFKAFVVEAYGADSETTVDLVAWPIGRPKRVMSMFGLCGLIGLWAALDPANYLFNRPIPIHRTPLDWIKSNCKGAAIVTPHIAARQLLDIPGRIEAQDQVHGRELKNLIESVIPKDRVVIRARIGRNAA